MRREEKGLFYPEFKITIGRYPSEIILKKKKTPANKWYLLTTDGIFSLKKYINIYY